MLIVSSILNFVWLSITFIQLEKFDVIKKKPRAQ